MEKTGADPRRLCIRETMYKKRAVAAQTARSRCKILSVQYVYAYYFRANQREKTLHGVGVITKLYFAILPHLRNNDLESRAEVIQGHTYNRKPVYDFI